MDQHEEDTHLAPMADTAREKKTGAATRFLTEHAFGIFTMNVFSNWFSKFLPSICVGLFSLWWKKWNDRRKKDAELRKQNEDLDVRNRKIEKDLNPHVSLTVKELDESSHEQRRRREDPGGQQEPATEELDESSHEQNRTREDPGGQQEPVINEVDDSTSERLDEVDKSRHEHNSRVVHSRQQPHSGLLCSQHEITADEGSSSALLHTRKRNSPGKGYAEVIVKCYIKKTTLQAINVEKIFDGVGGENVEYVVHEMHGSRILESSVRVSVQDGALLRNASDIVEEYAKIDKDFTLQIESWGIYYSDPDFSTGVQLFRLKDSKVPTIFSAEFAAGVLRIYGLHLEGAYIKAATSTKSKILNIVTHEKICGGKIDMLTCKDLLPDTNLRNLRLYAIMSVQVNPSIEGRRVINVLSSSVKIDDIHLKKALRDWLPTTVIVIFVARQLWLSMKPLWNAYYSEVYWTFPMLVIIFCTLMLPSRTEQWITERLGKLCFVLSRLKVYVGSLGCSGPESKETKKVQENQVLAVKTKKSPSIHKSRIRLPRSKESDLEDSDFQESEEELGSECEGTAETSEVEGEAIEVEGETTLVTPLKWEWDSFDLVKDKLGKVVRKKRTRAEPESVDQDVVPFSVIYENLSGAPWPERVYVHMKSTVLLDVVGTLVNTKQYPDDVGIMGRKLFLSLDKLKDELGRTDGGTDGGTDGAVLQLQRYRHLYHLVRFLEKEYAETSSRYERMNRTGCVSWDMLWTFLIPGKEVVYKCSVSEEEVCGIVNKASYRQDDRGNWHLLVKLRVYDYDCKTFEPYANLERSIDQFEGEIAFHALDAYPSRFPGKPGVSEKYFLNQGNSFGYLSTKAKCRYMHYTGIMYRFTRVNDCLQLLREKANGRVMIDLANFWKMNPGYPLGNAKPPCDVIRDNKVVEIDISDDPNRKFAPCIVYGFSFRLKKWGAFSVCGFDEIKYDVHAWDELVMDRDLKRMTEVLVGEHLTKKTIPDNQGPTGLDTISSKGDSCIILCYGPPGTGKTLTAEALADKERAPLWAMSVSELGITPDTLESQLVNILEVAHSWHALLLLDEADIYLERRSDGFDLARNAMTGIFLRQLEYYKGVLFLTTNRVATFDDAFRSRITLFLNYKALDSGQRKLIWRNFLNRANLAADEINEIVTKVSECELNGRQIRNVIQNAQKLATRSIAEGSKPLFRDLVIKTTQIMDKSVASVA